MKLFQKWKSRETNRGLYFVAKMINRARNINKKVIAGNITKKIRECNGVKNNQRPGLLELRFQQKPYGD